MTSVPLRSLSHIHRMLQLWSTRRTALLNVRRTLSVCQRPSGPGARVKEIFRPAKAKPTSGNKSPERSVRQDFSNSPWSIRLLRTATKTCINCPLSPHPYRRTSRRVADGNLPSAQEEMMTAKTAPIGLEQPMQGPLHGISGVYNSKINRLAVGTLCGEQPDRGAHRHLASELAAPSAAGVAGCWMDGEAYGSRKASRRLPTLRLTSRAAVTCSGVLRSGSETLTCCRARETWRLCRFNSLLSMVSFSIRLTLPKTRRPWPRW